ncbi:MAG: hypothetical protein LBM27_05305 [Lactobacillaceae bacterium]|jgi:hypothetical protein|nr:hypothetical protein [Lactobacillaceae bacterium]
MHLLKWLDDSVAAGKHNIYEENQESVHHVLVKSFGIKAFFKNFLSVCLISSVSWVLGLILSVIFDFPIFVSLIIAGIVFTSITLFNFFTV